MIVAISLGKPGINALLVVSQVVLSIVLPFVMFPLIWCTSSKTIMRVRKTGEAGEGEGEEVEGREEWVDFSNGKWITVLAAVVWLAIVVANVYVLVELAIG
jgi:metal iron transporter